MLGLGMDAPRARRTTALSRLRRRATARLGHPASITGVWPVSLTGIRPPLIAAALLSGSPVAAGAGGAPG